LDLRAGVAHGRDGDWESEWAQRRVADCVVCWVEDSGPGVVLEDPERIFDPFFTTKAPGEGTGLGLANARRLAEEMDGRVELDPNGSSLGGARFCFVLGSDATSSTDAENDGTRPGNQSRMP
jgi:signal transduction histidine kinase